MDGIQHERDLVSYLHREGGKGADIIQSGRAVILILRKIKKLVELLFTFEAAFV